MKTKKQKNQELMKYAAMLIFAKEMIKTPDRFCYYSGGRKKPYLK